MKSSERASTHPAPNLLQLIFHDQVLGGVVGKTDAVGIIAQIRAKRIRQWRIWFQGFWHLWAQDRGDRRSLA
jgi:hypothetical protein